MLVQNMDAGRSWRSLVPELQQMIGVTVRQADALVALRTRLLASEMKEARVGNLWRRRRGRIKDCGRGP